MFLPLLFNVEKHKVTIIGGGKIALRKAKKIIEYGGEVICISPEFEKEFLSLDKVHCIKARYFENLLDEGLVIAATNDKKLNQDIYDECHRKGLYCMHVDSGENSDFIFSASQQTEELIFSVSTKGKNPAKAKRILERLMADYYRISQDMDKENTYEN